VEEKKSKYGACRKTVLKTSRSFRNKEDQRIVYQLLSILFRILESNIYHVISVRV